MSATGVVVTLPAMRRLAVLSRLALLAAAALALAASAAKPTPSINEYNQNGGQPAVPRAQAMDPRAPLGLWNTNFGAVKLESDGAGLHGAWSYDRDGQQVIGYFGGVLDGNVLRLTWREPAQATPGVPQLAGAGWLAFDPSGTTFAGKWWSDDRQRSGDWTGTRAAQPLPDDSYGYGGTTYGNAYGGSSYGVPGGPAYPPPSYPTPAPYNPPPSSSYPPPGYR
jgi:hypothetical protein